MVSRLLLPIASPSNSLIIPNVVLEARGSNPIFMAYFFSFPWFPLTFGCLTLIPCIHTFAFSINVLNLAILIVVTVSVFSLILIFTCYYFTLFIFPFYWPGPMVSHLLLPIASPSNSLIIPNVVLEARGQQPHFHGVFFQLSLVSFNFWLPYPHSLYPYLCFLYPCT